MLVEQRQHGHAAELVVGLIDQYGGCGGPFQNLFQPRDLGASPGGIIWITDQDSSGLRSDPV
jgi:hypothetical protein